MTKSLRRRLWCSNRLGGTSCIVTNLKRSIDDSMIDEYPGSCVFLWILEDPLDCATVPAMHLIVLVLEGQIAGPALEVPVADIPSNAVRFLYSFSDISAMALSA